jgi:hypothetical protein
MNVLYEFDIRLTGNGFSLYPVGTPSGFGHSNGDFDVIIFLVIFLSFFRQTSVYCMQTN